jgi:hypothetical protein
MNRLALDLAELHEVLMNMREKVGNHSPPEVALRGSPN